MQPLLKQVLDSALNLIFPINCLGCSAEGAYICDDCMKAAPRLRPPCCAYCAQPSSATPCRWCRASPLGLDGITAPFLMEGVVRDAVLQLKYQQVRGLAPMLADPMEKAWRAKNLSPDLVMPVPLHRRRLRQRGYNQSALLAQSLSKTLEIPFDQSALTRTRDTGPQVGLTRSERDLNVNGAFHCNGSVAGKAVLIVDDVATTGSTLAACADALRKADAASVWGLILARETVPSTQADDASRPFRRPMRAKRDSRPSDYRANG